MLVGKVPVFSGTRDDALAFVLECVRSKRGARVATANLDFLARANSDAVLAQDLRDSSLVTADGAPVAWLARRAGAPEAGRYAGVDLVRDLCHAARLEGGMRVGIYGATPDVAARAAASLNDVQGVSVVCVTTPPFRPLSRDEQALERRAISESQPDVMLVALGCPRQERLIAAYFESAPEAVWIGVGGTLDLIAGVKRRAPGWCQSLGCEWIVRLLQEPRRLWRRYLLRDLPYFLRLCPGYLFPRAH